MNCIILNLIQHLPYIKPKSKPTSTNVTTPILSLPTTPEQTIVDSPRHSWTIKKDSLEWTIALKPHLQVTQNSSRFIQLLELSLKRIEDSRPVLSEIYGERLTNEIFQVYHLPTLRPLNSPELEVFMIATAARVTGGDLRVLQDRILNNRVGNTTLTILLEDREYAELQSLASKDYDSLNNAEIHTLVNFFRRERIVLADQTSQEFQNIDLSDSRHARMRAALSNPSLQHLFKRDMELLNNIQAWSRFASSTDKELVNTEMFARYFAYSHLSKGALLPTPHAEHSSVPVYYQVSGGIDEKGFACYFLTGVASEYAHSIKLLARGTVTSDPASLAANLGKTSGKLAYKKYRSFFFKALKEIIEQHPHTNLQLEIHGHSMGGALTQHILSSIVGEIARDLKNKIIGPWKKISNFKIQNWNSPAITKHQDLKFANNLVEIEKHPATANMVFDLVYLRVNYDIIQKFGEVFLGFFRKSNNINVKIVYFPLPSYMPLIGQHMQPIILSTKEQIKPSLILEDNRVTENGWNKKIQVVSHLISMQENIQQIEAYAKRFVENAKSAFTALLMLNIVELEALLTSPQAMDFEQLGLKKNQYLRLIQALILNKELNGRKEYIDVLAKDFPALLESLTALSLSELKKTLDVYELLKDQRMNVIYSNAQKINFYMSNTAFEYLPQKFKYLLTPVINWFKYVIKRALISEQTFALTTQHKIQEEFEKILGLAGVKK